MENNGQPGAQPGATETRERHLIAVLRGICGINQLITSENNPRHLIERACEHLTAAMGYHNAWIALLGSEARQALGLSPQGAVSATASAGFNGGFAIMREQLLRGEFPACMACTLETGDTRLTGDPALDCPDCSLAGDYGGCAGLTRRLDFDGVTYGVLSASVPVEYAKDAEEQELFDELARDLAFGLHKIATARRLEESRRSYRDLFEKHSAAKLIIDPDEGRIIDANAAAAKFYGWSREELCRMRISDINTLTPAQIKTEMDKARALERTHFEFEHRRADGSIRDVAVFSSRVESAGKELLYSIIHDITARKEAEEALREKSEEQAWLLKSMFNAFVLFDSVFDVNGEFVSYRFRYINEAYERITGVRQEDVFGKTVHEVWPETEASWIENYGSAAMTGKTLSFDMYHKPTAKHYHCYVYRPWDTNQQFCVVFEDITERKRAEEDIRAANQQLRASEQQFQAYNQQLNASNQQLAASEAALQSNHALLQIAGETARFGGWSVDLATNRSTWSDVVADIHEMPHGYSPKVEQGIAFYLPEWRERITQVFTACAEQGAPYDEDLQILTHTGKRIWVRTIGQAVRNEQGIIVQVQGAFQDITKRKQAEEDIRAANQQLRAAEQQLRAESDRLQVVMQTAPVAILMVDEHERIVQVNRAAEALFGTAGGSDDEPLRCGDIIACVHRHESPEGCGHGEACTSCVLYRAIRDGLAGLSVDDLETEIQVENNGTKIRRQILLNAAPLRLGNRLGVILAANDITQMRALHAQMAQSDRLSSMGMLAAGVAHEINNPLSYVLYNLESLTEDLPKLIQAVRDFQHQIESPEIGESSPRRAQLAQVASPAMLDDILARFKNALSGTQRIREVSRGLGTFSRVEKDQAAPVNLMHVIDVATNMAFNEIKYRARLVKDYGRNLPTVLASEGRLGQVFLNLIINATHAIDEGDLENNEIRVKTWSEGDSVYAQVQDTGSGIPPENMGKLFDAFFTTKKIGVGSGLGLAISKEIVEGYGGSIEVESEVGQGTCFTLRLPVPSQVPTDDDKVQPVASETSARGRILIVDDEDGIRVAMVMMLRGHETVQAANGAEAKQILESDQAFDLILCDMMMPAVSGMDLHRWLIEANPGLAKRLIFITGGAFTPHARDYLSQVDNLRLEKPFDVANFKKIVSDRITLVKGMKLP